MALFFILGQGCSPEEARPELTSYQKEVIAYFNKVTLGFEFGNATPITRKWVNDMMLFAGGEQHKDLSGELDKIIREINELATDGFKITLVKDSLLSNYYLFLGTGEQYAKKYPGEADLVNSNFGLFNVSWDGHNNLNSGHMYVDTHRTDSNAQKHLLREELTQSLGLARDALDYPESIFQQNWTTTTTYAPIDKDLIRLLYHPRMKSGLNEMQADQVLTAILLNE
jgi:hypothetical protein